MSGGMALASRVPFDCGSGGRCMQHGIDAVSSQLDLIEEALERGIPRRRLDLRSPDDHIGVSFHLATGICLAATVFFFFQVALVPRRWANSMIIAGLVTGIAWHHYMHMEDVWAASGKAPTVWRYMDWLITVPLQVVEFYTILCAANPNNDIEIKIALLLRLLMASLFMLGFGYAGEAEWIDRWVAFTLGVLCWIYIIYEISFGETAGIAGQLGVEDARRFLRHIQNRSKEQEDEENAIIKQALEEKQKQASSSGFSSIVASVTTAAKGNVNADTVAMQDMKKPEAQLAFELIRAILIFGWALYPIGYLSKGARTIGGECAQRMLQSSRFGQQSSVWSRYILRREL
ncbi:unnamed protein product [Amoebophrya sp. A25]|nr:unnamed protein product [Amoebophrya sp. A25]|eukprot:GSA25T00015195001.1